MSALNPSFPHMLKQAQAAPAGGRLGFRGKEAQGPNPIILVEPRVR